MLRAISVLHSRRTRTTHASLRSYSVLKPLVTAKVYALVDGDLMLLMR